MVHSPPAFPLHRLPKPLNVRMSPSPVSGLLTLHSLHSLLRTLSDAPSSRFTYNFDDFESDSSSLGEEQQKCCPPCKMLSWSGFGHRNLSRKALCGSFLRNGSLITLSPFLPGIETGGTARRWPMIDNCLPPFRLVNIRLAVLFFSFVPALSFLRH
jgi:hypothetical protein